MNRKIMGCIGHDFFKYLGLVVKDRIKPLLRISVQNLFALRLNLVAACQMATHEKCETLFNKLREMERLLALCTLQNLITLWKR